MALLDTKKYNYERVKHTDSEGKTRHTTSNGDAMAVALRGLTLSEVEDVARRNGVPEASLDKWSHLNAGMRRMNMGLALRKIVKGGTPVHVGDHTVTSL